MTTPDPAASTTETPATETPPTDQQAPETPEVETPPADESKTGDELPPEVLRKELTNARAEAANYRTRLREAEQKLTEAKTPEEYAAAVSDLQTKNAELERSLLVTKVAAEAKLPADLAELLKGEDEAALKEHAKVLAKYAPAEESDPETLGGGLSPNGTSDETFDARAVARKARRR